MKFRYEYLYYFYFPLECSMCSNVFLVEIFYRLLAWEHTQEDWSGLQKSVYQINRYDLYDVFYGTVILFQEKLFWSIFSLDFCLWEDMWQAGEVNLMLVYT